MGTEGSKKSHFLAADLLRGIAIIMVVIYHSFGRVCGACLPWNGWFRNFAAPPSQMFLYFYPVTFGWAGVSLFFVLSGFCIHLSFLRSKEFSTGTFFWRRFWRIAPAYYVALMAFFFWHHYTFGTGWKTLLAHLLFTHNLYKRTFFEINASFWSIATEVQLYLLFPIILMLRKRSGGMKTCLIVTFTAGILWRAVGVCRWGLPDPESGVPWLVAPVTTWFDWTLGAFVAERLVESRRAFSFRRLWVAVALPVFMISTLYKPLTIFSFTLAAIVSAVTLDWLLWTGLRTTAANGWLVFIGTISYSIYLWHQPLLTLLPLDLTRYVGGNVADLLVPILILLISVASYQIFERGGIFVGATILQRFRPATREATLAIPIGKQPDVPDAEPGIAET